MTDLSMPNFIRMKRRFETHSSHSDLCVPARDWPWRKQNGLFSISLTNLTFKPKKGKPVVQMWNTTVMKSYHPPMTLMSSTDGERIAAESSSFTTGCNIPLCSCRSKSLQKLTKLCFVILKRHDIVFAKICALCYCSFISTYIFVYVFAVPSCF